MSQRVAITCSVSRLQLLNYMEWSVHAAPHNFGTETIMGLHNSTTEYSGYKQLSWYQHDLFVTIRISDTKCVIMDLSGGSPQQLRDFCSKNGRSLMFLETFCISLRVYFVTWKRMKVKNAPRILGGKNQKYKESVMSVTWKNKSSSSSLVDKSWREGKKKKPFESNSKSKCFICCLYDVHYVSVTHRLTSTCTVFSQRNKSFYRTPPTFLAVFWPEYSICWATDWSEPSCLQSKLNCLQLKCLRLFGWEDWKHKQTVHVDGDM